MFDYTPQYQEIAARHATVNDIVPGAVVWLYGTFGHYRKVKVRGVVAGAVVVEGPKIDNPQVKVWACPLADLYVKVD